jgi:hypothetical protein
VIFYLRSNGQLFDIKPKNMKVLGGILSWSLGRAVSEWYDYGSKEGGRYGSQDRQHDMPQAAQEAAGRQAIAFDTIKKESFDEDS